tara:strand:+ start:235 stop:396 length:162 start_codon:yes stop_codon:yes gene_type:complete
MPFSKYTDKQKKLAMVAEPRDVINKKDFDKLRQQKKDKPLMKALKRRKKNGKA